MGKKKQISLVTEEKRHQIIPLKGFTLGAIFGITISVDPSWLVIFLLVVWNLSLELLPAINPVWPLWFSFILGIAVSLLFFSSVLVHELAHSVVAKARGLPISRITLFIFGGVSNLDREPNTPLTEFIMAIVGPATSFIVAILFIIIAQALASQNGFPANSYTDIFLWLASVNIMLGLFNLIPGFPLDGGRVLRSIIWSYTGKFLLSTRIASMIGQIVAGSLIFSGLIMIFGQTIPLFGQGIGGGIWLAFIGWFLSTAAEQSYQNVKRVELNQDISGTDNRAIRVLKKISYQSR